MKLLREPGRRRRRRLRLEPLESRILLVSDLMPALVRDINEHLPVSHPAEMVQVGDKIFLAAEDKMYGRELFVIENGGQPTLVKDIVPGFLGSAPTELTNVNGLLFFTADDGEHGRELWKSDGTAAGTVMVEDLNPGSDEFFGLRSSNPSRLTAAGDELFFVAESAATGSELYRASATAASLVRDIHPGQNGAGNPNHSHPDDLLFVPAHTDEDGQLVPATLFFSAENGTNGRELWQTVIIDGNTQTTLLKNLAEDRLGDTPRSSNPLGLIRFQGEVYFRAAGGEFNSQDEYESAGAELWKTDGTAEGTMLVADTFPGETVNAQQQLVPNNGAPGDFTIHNGQLYFAANTGPDGRELWKTDGETVTQVRDIRSGSIGSAPTDLISTDGFLFFIADGGQGRELWRSNGTSAGTQLTRDIRSGNNTPFLFTRGLAKLGNSVIFGADDGILGPEVWISDGSLEGTHLLREIQFGRNSAVVPEGFTTIDGHVYFEAAGKLWRSDGTEAGTTQIELITQATVDSLPDRLAAALGLVFFAADDGRHGVELWKSDGTPGGTSLVRDVAPGSEITFPGSMLATPRSSFPEEITTVGDAVFFRADALTGTSLWKTNGTAVGTVLVKNIDARELVSFGGKLYFTADSPAGTELWSSDGTADGTQVLHDLAEGASSSFPSQLTVFGDQLFFVADDGGGRELWVTNGTEDGAIKIDLAPEGGSSPFQLTAGRDRLYFAADDGVHGAEVWSSDGTSEGTRLARDINTAEFAGSRPLLVAALEDQFLFFADDGVTGQALWTTQGTPETTALVKDIQPGEEDEFLRNPEEPQNLFAMAAGKLYFAADDGEHGQELWMTDATLDGTRLVQDLFPGPDGSAPSELHGIGDHLYFSALHSAPDPEDPESFFSLGSHLWSLDGAAGSPAMRFDINQTNDSGSDPRTLTSISGTMYFTADDGLKGRELWTLPVPLTPVDVNSVGDRADSDPADGVCNTGSFVTRDGQSEPECTLRAAITNANATGGANIRFNIPGTPRPDRQLTIRPASPFDAIIQPTVIDGSTQPGFAGRPLIEIDGSLAPDGTNGLEITAGHSTVRSLVINRFAAGAGIKISGGGSNVIAATYLGTHFSGEFADIDGEPETGDEFGNEIGIRIDNSSRNRIGGSVPMDRNLVSGNLMAGIVIEGEAGGFNEVRGNLIGTNIGAFDAVGNLGPGVDIRSEHNVVGGYNPGEGNVISANEVGVWLNGSTAHSNLLLGNWIGTGIDGELSSPITLLGNTSHGIRVTDASGNLLSGSSDDFGAPCDPEAPQNTIAANRGAGIRVEGDVSMANPLRCNTIHTNDGLGIDLGSAGVTPNDPTDSDDSSPRNYPIISLTSRVENETLVDGMITSRPNTQLVIDFFATDTRGATKLEHAEQGARFLGSILVTTDDTGYAKFTADRLAVTDNFEVITATATDAEGHTSEFSPPTPDFVGSGGFEVRTPVLVVPGIFGSFAPEDANVIGSDATYREYLTTLGIHPEKLVLDPIATVYDDLINTLRRAGYEDGQDLFEAPYDWRINLAPFTGAISERDGVITGVTAASLTDNAIEYGLDYLGYWLKQAAESWYERFQQPLTNVHIIAHSMGGVLSRSYMQSTAYGDSFMSTAAGRSLPLPVVSNFTMLGVPHQGGAGTFNGWNDNFVGTIAYRLVLSKVISHAWEKLHDGYVIGYPSGFGDEIRLSDFEGLSDEDAKIRFVRRYVAGLGNLLPSYPGFAENFSTAAMPEFTNRLLADLNARLLFGDRVAHAQALYGTSEETPTKVQQNIGGFFDPEDFIPIIGSSLVVPDEILSFTDFLARDPAWGEVYFTDILLDAHGDGTVALESLEGLFINDPRVKLVSFCKEDETCRSVDTQVSGEVSHTSLVSNVDAQDVILRGLHHPLQRTDISTGSELSGLWDNAISVISTVTPWAAYNLFVDPVASAFLVDSQGRRFGFDEQAGRVHEIPDSFYLGGTDGIGWIFAPVEGPLTLQLTGRGEDHFVQVTGLHDGDFFGADSKGMLAQGETRTVEIPLPIDEPLGVRFLGPFEGDGVIEGATLQVILDKTGDVVPRSVELFVEDESVGIKTSEPFEFEVVVPEGVNQLRLRAVAVADEQTQAEAQTSVRVFPPMFLDPDSLVTGSGEGQPPLVRVFNAQGEERFSFFAFDPGFLGGVNVAVGDVNGDGTPDIITSAGHGAVPFVRVVEGNHATTISHFFAYGLEYTGGVSVATGDVNGDGKDEIITGPASGAAQPIRVFDAQTRLPLSSHLPFGDSLFGGVSVATGDVNGDGRDDIVVGAGGTPQVRVFDVASPDLIQSFLAFPGFPGGVRVATGDVNGDGLADIITGAGAGGGPHVKVFDLAATEIASFFAYDLPFDNGLFVAGTDIDDDGDDDIVTAPGPGGGAHVKVFDVSGGEPLVSFPPYGADFPAGVLPAGVIQSKVTSLELPELGGVFEVHVEQSDIVVRRPTGEEVLRRPQLGIVRLHLQGADEVDDQLVVDLGELPIPITFTGGAAGNDSLSLVGQQPRAFLQYQFLNRFDGIISTDPAAQLPGAIVFTGLEPVADSLDVADRVFSFPVAGTNITLNTGSSADDPLLRIASDQSEVVDFPQPTGTLTIELSGGATKLTIEVPEFPRILGQGAGNQLVIAGSGVALDLTQIADGDLQGIDVIDLRGSGANTLTLNAEEVLNLSASSDTLRIQHDIGDTINYGSGWKVELPQIVAGQYLHRLTQNGATLEVVNSTPFRNPLRPLDVNRDGSTSLIDILNIINRLNQFGAGALPAPADPAELSSSFFYVDTNGDRSLAPNDILVLLNFLLAAGGSPEAESAGAALPWSLVQPIDASKMQPAGSQNRLEADERNDVVPLVLPAMAPLAPPAVSSRASNGRTDDPCSMPADAPEMLAAIDDFFSDL